MTAAQFAQWLQDSTAGDAVVYHRGANLEGCQCAHMALTAAGYRLPPASVSFRTWVQDLPKTVALTQRKVAQFHYEYIATRLRPMEHAA